jgi:maltose O-acetyltransferase
MVGEARPVTIEDNVWIGFDSIILPGVNVGRGSIVGCKTIVDTDIASYSIVVGNPARVVRVLAPDDTEAARRRALQECLRA